jgi:hypothetical protein
MVLLLSAASRTREAFYFPSRRIFPGSGAASCRTLAASLSESQVFNVSRRNRINPLSPSVLMQGILPAFLNSINFQ